MRLGTFFDVYRETCAAYPAPEAFHRWSALSLVAATVGNRVWTEKWVGSPIYPNLYVILVGPSGCGKGVSTDFALRLWAGIPELSESNRLYRGGLTKQRVLDLLGGRTTTVVAGEAQVGAAPPVAQPWIVSPELYHAIEQSGRHAESFIAMLTDLYSASPVPVKEGTRTWGDVTIVGHCINWLAGSTSQWLRKSLSPDAILSGFFGRVVTIEGSYASTTTSSLSPSAIAQNVSRLSTRLAQLSTLSGPCSITSQAQDVREHWLANREPPEDEMMRPAYQRDDELLMKLATLLSVSESDQLVIEREHMVRARWLVAEARRAQPKLITLAYTRPEMDAMAIVSDKIRHAGMIAHSVLLRAVGNRGITSDGLSMCLRTLSQAGRIKTFNRGRGLWYEWVDERKAFP